MDFLPLTPDDRVLLHRRRGPVAWWLLVVMIAVIVGAAALGSALTDDTRDFKAKHGSVLATRLI